MKIPAAKNFITRTIKNNKMKTNKILEVLRALGGFLVLMYVPLVIGMIWFDLVFMLKLILSNTIVILSIIGVEKIMKRLTH